MASGEENPRDVLHFFAIEKRHSERSRYVGHFPNPLWKKTQQANDRSVTKVGPFPKIVPKYNCGNYLQIPVENGGARSFRCFSCNH